MCGIGGYQVLEGGKLPSPKSVLQLLEDLSTRGTDAAGLGWMEDDSRGGKIRYLKYPMSSKALAQELKPRLNKVWPDGLPDGMILHARAQTSGSPKNPRNNHPVLAFRPKTVAVVHNGVLYDTDETFKRLGYRPKCEVDTEALALALSVGLDRTPSWQSALSEVQSCQGSAAFAAISPVVEGIAVAKGSDGAALAFGFDEANQIIWWASEEWMLPIHTYTEVGGIKNWRKQFPTLTPLAGDALVLSPKGVTELHFPKILSSRTVYRGKASTTQEQTGGGGASKVWIDGEEVEFDVDIPPNHLTKASTYEQWKERKASEIALEATDLVWDILSVQAERLYYAQQPRR